MANGTPSNTIPLGSALLNAMGDIKGAAKAMGDEAKEAKKSANETNKELKAAQRELKKTNASIDRLKKRGGTLTQEQKTEQKRLQDLVDSKSNEAFKRSKVASETAIKAQAAKDKIKSDRDRIKNMNAYEKRVNSKLIRVQDTMQGVSRTLQSAGSPALQAIGRQVGNAAGAMSTETMATAARVGGLALRGLGLGAAGVAGGFAVAGIGERYYRRNIEENRIKGQISDTMTAAFNSLAGRTVSSSDAALLTGGFKQATNRAQSEIRRESFTGRLLGTSGTIAEFFGTSRQARKREEALGKIFLQDRQLSERFGEKVAGDLDLAKLQKSKGVRDIVNQKISEDYVRGVLTKVVSAPGSAMALKPLLDLYYSATDETAINEQAQKQRANNIKAIENQMKADKKRVSEDAKNASKRKQNSIRDQRLEEERLRRNMQTARA